jgi:hypothetical protein
MLEERLDGQEAICKENVLITAEHEGWRHQVQTRKTLVEHQILHDSAKMRTCSYRARQTHADLISSR